MTRVLVLGVMLFSAGALADLPAQARAVWLDEPMTSWSRPTPGVPASGITADAHAALDRRCGSTATSTSIGALRSARWTPFLHLDQAIARNDIEVIGGMTGASPGCEPTVFHLFVFVGGKFAGTVSPDAMTPSRDGAAGAVRITAADAMTVEFARYTPGDSECCPSSRLRVSYRIDKTGAGPTLVATEARKVR